MSSKNRIQTVLTTLLHLAQINYSQMFFQKKPEKIKGINMPLQKLYAHYSVQPFLQSSCKEKSQQMKPVVIKHSGHEVDINRRLYQHNIISR